MGETISEINLKEESRLIAQQYKELLSISYQTLTKEDKKQIRLAFDVSVEAHSKQRRKSGEAYVLHPIAVAKIVASQIGMDATSIIAALLHDVVEDTNYTMEDINRIFGKTVGRIVDGLTKIPVLGLDKNISSQAENFRKVLLTMNKDIRVIIIKIADRLHNMKTIDTMPAHKQAKIGSETLYIYAPIAHRLGLYNIKIELEDLGFKYTNPHQYKYIKNKIEGSREQQQLYIENFTKIIDGFLKESNISYTIKGRPKTIFSIMQKMIRKNIGYEDVYDKFAIRIVYKSSKIDEKVLAWKIYSAITDHLQPNPLRLRDWITSPKITGYEALHITVMGPNGRWVEIQIRSERMNEIAERGYATHYKYKHKKEKGFRLDKQIDLLRESLEDGHENPVDFVNEFRLDLYDEEIFVFTPKGEVKSLPSKSTPLDYAFAIHTEVGLHAKSAKVNGKLVPLDYTLRTGDQVHIVTFEKALPNKDWMEYVKTSRAKSAIRGFFKKQELIYQKEGKELLRRKLKQLKIECTQKVEQDLLNFLSLDDLKDLYCKVKRGMVTNAILRDFATKKNRRVYSFIKKRIRFQSIPKTENIKPRYGSVLFGTNQEKLPYKIEPCCNPVAGDEIFGFDTFGKVLAVHKSNCSKALDIQSNYAYRILTAKWTDSNRELFTANLRLRGIDNIGILKKISIISSDMNINIKRVLFQAKSGVFDGDIEVEVENQNVIVQLIKKIKKIKGIEKIWRV